MGKSLNSIPTKSTPWWKKLFKKIGPLLLPLVIEVILPILERKLSEPSNDQSLSTDIPDPIDVPTLKK